VLERIEDLELLNAAAHGGCVCADNAQGLLEQPGLVLWRRSCNNVRTNNDDGQGWGKVRESGRSGRGVLSAIARDHRGNGSSLAQLGEGGARNWVGS
jgi:hypothetical protein